MTESTGLQQLDPSGSGTHRDLQRAALRDLLLLSTETARTDSEIERQHHATREEGDKQLKRTTWEITGRFEARKGEVREKYEQRVAEIEAKYQAETAALNDAIQTARQRVELEAESIEHDVTKEVDHAVWLTESLYEVELNQAREESKQAREELRGQVESLDSAERRAAQLLGRYRRELPPAQRAPQAAAEGGAAAAASDFAQLRESVERQLSQLNGLKSPRLLVGATPYVLGTIWCIAAVFVTYIAMGGGSPRWGLLGVAAVAALAVAVALGLLLRSIANARLAELSDSLAQSLAEARAAGKGREAEIEQLERQKRARAKQEREQEVQRVRSKAEPVLARAAGVRQASLQSVNAQVEERVAAREAARGREREEIEQWQRSSLQDLQEQQDRELQAARERHERQRGKGEDHYRQGRTSLERRWAERLTQIQAPIGPGRETTGQVAQGRDDPDWSTWSPPKTFASAVRFGELRVDLKQVVDSVPANGRFQLPLPPPFAVPTALGFPQQASLLIQTDREGRAEALQTLQMVMARLLTSLPAGRVNFTIIDPVGLGQNFAGFMHLADYDEALVGRRIWTDAEQIQQRLADLTEHMETVIQKYLRNEFQTIDDYNAQAGELAEPYRFLVIADFPAGFESEAFRRLNSIAASGARCGVYTLIVRDTRLALPQGSQLDELEANSVNIVREDGRFVWKDEVFARFPLTLDPPPSEDRLTQIVHVVGKHARESKRVEVSFETIAPSKEQFWSGDSTDELQVPIGRMGATRLQMLKLGKGVAQHVLIAGKTGSGKSTLLHVLVTNLAMWYSPREVEFFLIDFKKGVEFKTYATQALPHARAIAVESDREFGLSVLQRLDAELVRRGDLFRQAAVQDIAGYRRTPNARRMPRTLLIIDEFQEFFSEDDTLAQEAALLLDRLVRQGRAFGVHVLLGSQTIGGSSGLPRSTIGQMVVRIALQTSEADSQLVLGDNNSAARLLSRPGEAIYNDAGGLVEANSPFQVAWLPDDQREQYLAKVRATAQAKAERVPATVVFEGNAPSDITRNVRLARLLQAPAAPSGPLLAWLGEPVAIKEPTAVTFRRQSGSNLLIIGQQEESAMALVAGAIISLAAHHAPGTAQFYVLDGTPADSPLAGVLPRVKQALPHDARIIEWRAINETISEIAGEMRQRQASDPAGLPEIYLIVYGLQRFRMLRKKEDEFSLSNSSDEEKKSDPGKDFAELLREGPAVGIHVIAWSDTPIALERTLDRTALREFDNRVLFQMSANDSSNLIDSPGANKLGFYRALAYSEEQGVTEKFRPYALPPQAWLDQVKARLAGRAVKQAAATTHSPLPLGGEGPAEGAKV